MGSALALLGAGLRRRYRSVGAIGFAVALVAGLAIAVLLPSGGAAGAAVALENALVVLGVGAALAAAASAGALAEDHASGVHAWLAATRAPRPLLRATPAVAGMLATVAVASVAGVILVGLLLAKGLEVPTRRTTPLPFGEAGMRAERGSGMPGSTRRDAWFLESWIDGIGGPSGAVVPVEVDVRPRFRSPEAAGVGAVRLAIDDAPGTPDDARAKAPLVPVRGRTILDLAAGHRVDLSSLDPRVDLRLVGARRIDGPASFAANVLLAALLAGLALASLAPLAVLLSRGLSAATAVATTLVLGAVGVLHGPLLALAADAEAVAGGAAGAAASILRGAAFVAPDLSGIARASDAVEGHALDAGAFAALAPPALHALVTLALLAFVPARRCDP